MLKSTSFYPNVRDVSFKIRQIGASNFLLFLFLFLPRTKTHNRVLNWSPKTKNQRSLTHARDFQGNLGGAQVVGALSSASISAGAVAGRRIVFWNMYR